MHNSKKRMKKLIFEINLILLYEKQNHKHYIIHEIMKNLIILCKPCIHKFMHNSTL